MVAVMISPVAIPPAIAIAGTILGVVGFGLLIAMQISSRELRRLVLTALALVVLVGVVTKLRADTVINDPVVALCRTLDPEENWILWWLYDCEDVLRNAGR
jgi:hypothetical protein